MPSPVVLAAKDRWRDPDDLYVAARQVKDLLEHPGWLAVMGLVTDLREKKLHHLVYTTKVREQAEYAKGLGEVQGIEAAQAAAAGIVEAAEDVERHFKRQEKQRGGIPDGDT